MPARLSQLAGRDRLRGLLSEHKQAEESMRIERVRFEALAEDRAKAIAVSSDNLFPTPPALAARVAAMAELRPGMRVLEPSAGTGNLIAALAPWGNLHITAVEIDQNVFCALTKRFATIAAACCADFLTLGDGLGLFDRIVMNPPFRRGADVKHIEHAATKLAPGGRLVAICANGSRQQDALQPLASQWYELPAGSFKSEGTNVNTAIVVIDN